MPFDATPLGVNTLPALLAGPILRRLTRTSVSVWVALSIPDAVTLHVRQQNPAGPEQTVTGTPQRVGQNLWLAVLTVSGANFTAGTAYEYWLTSPGWPANRAPNWAEFGYRGANRPTFTGLPATLDQFVVLHVSCRRPHANRRDGLAHAHRILSDAVQPRPHLLILSGDQIYADDVGSVLTPRIRRVAADLVNIDETGVFGALTPIGARQQPTLDIGLSSDAAKDHLFTLGEFYAMYLLAWSDALWPANLPQWADRSPGEIQEQINGETNPQIDEEIWNNEVSNLELFRQTLPGVRKMLANVPILMICDDHEVTDDWNLDYNWCRAAYTNNQGRRVVANGMLAYFLFQHWGNRPQPFGTPGTPEASALNAATWTSPTHPFETQPNLLNLLGVPSAATVPTPFPAGGINLRDLSVGTSVRYDYTLDAADGYPLRLVLLDERTCRRFEEDDLPCGRVAPPALDLMWPAPAGNAADTPTLLIAPAPVLGLHIIEHVLQPAFALKDKGEQERDYEGWSALTSSFEYLLDRINAYRRVVILSGDVHFGYTKELTYQKPPNAALPGKAAQFVASASKYSIGLTIMLHLAGDMMQKLGIVRARTSDGYAALNAAQRNALLNAPPAGSVLPYDDVADVLLGRVAREGQRTPAVFSEPVATAYNLGQPGWRYTIEHVDDERPAPPGNLLNAMNAATATGKWPGWNRNNSIQMMRALRASDLHMIGRIFVGLPVLARITFDTTAGLQAQHELFASLGDQEPGGEVVPTITAVSLG